MAPTTRSKVKSSSPEEVTPRKKRREVTPPSPPPPHDDDDDDNSDDDDDESDDEPQDCIIDGEFFKSMHAYNKMIWKWISQSTFIWHVQD